MRLVVVGGGVMGLAAAHVAMLRGARVTLLERDTIPNPLGSSGDETRVIRNAYGEADHFAAMVGDAFAAWGRLWASLGVSHYEETGCLCVSTAPDDWATKSAASLRRIGAPGRWLVGDALADAPGAGLIRHDGLRGALMIDCAGVLHAARIVAALRDALVAGGADVRERVEVLEVDPACGSARLADGADVEGDALILAAGPWIARLAPTLAPRAVASRQTVVTVEPPADLAQAWGAAPVIADIGASTGLYLTPPRPGAQMKLGDHLNRAPGDPDGDRTPDAAVAERILAAARVRLLDFGRFRIIGPCTCFYTLAPGDELIVERTDRMVAMSPCSGHGFKFAALLGERAAGLAMDA